MRLVIFDIDGTLTDTAGLHHDLITAVLAADGLDVTFQPWAAYPHYTDLGVLDELYRHFRGRGIRDEELARYDRLYAEALSRHAARQPIREVTGAGDLLAGLAGMPDVRLAFATGSLRGMAEQKLAALGLDAAHLALATGGDYLTREEIVLAATEAATGGETPETAIILGDGLWDQRTAANLGLAFVGLETGLHRFTALPDTPAPVARISDYRNFDAALLMALARPIIRPILDPIMETPR